MFHPLQLTFNIVVILKRPFSIPISRQVYPNANPILIITIQLLACISTRIPTLTDPTTSSLSSQTNTHTIRCQRQQTRYTYAFLRLPFFPFVNLLFFPCTSRRINRVSVCSNFTNVVQYSTVLIHTTVPHEKMNHPHTTPIQSNHLHSTHPSAHAHHQYGASCHGVEEGT